MLHAVGDRHCILCISLQVQCIFAWPMKGRVSRCSFCVHCVTHSHAFADSWWPISCKQGIQGNKRLGPAFVFCCVCTKVSVSFEQMYGSCLEVYSRAPASRMCICISCMGIIQAAGKISHLLLLLRAARCSSRIKRWAVRRAGTRLAKYQSCSNAGSTEAISNA